ncbi:MAG: endonuclease/exonuclease/phosphatase [Chloroflexi bacterium]|nr:endonuclease/exonuclease/phosphatase [Chloroflexota bacterium]
MLEYNVAFWNVENLFDEEDSPRRTEKLERTIGRELKDWTPELLDRKLDQLASIIQQMNDGNGPDLLGVCEVENEHVLNLLVAKLAALGRNYMVAHDDTADSRGIDVAYIYDAAVFTAEEQFSHYIVKRSATRDLFQVNFRTNSGNLLVVVGNHWPSRSRGQYETEPYRIIAAETLGYFHERIRAIQQNTNVAVLAMGDFNDEPFDRSLVNYALSEQTRSKVTRARSPKFLNLMWPILGERKGTYFYNNDPMVLDQFMVSKGLVTGKSGITADINSAKVVTFPEMVATGVYKKPVRFGRGTSPNVDGFSDHFPIMMRLSEV